MSFLQREKDRLNRGLNDSTHTEKYDQLYAAQQALAWAIDPESAKAPFDMIMGIPGGSKDCLADPHPPQSSDTCGHCV